MKLTIWITLLTLFLPCGLRGQSASDPNIAKIRAEALQHSDIMENAFYLSDVYGPRFTGSPNFKAASDWLAGRLQAYGLRDIHREKVDLPIDVGGGLTWSGRGWTFDRFTAEMLKPTYSALAGEPSMFSGSTPGSVRGTALSISLPSPGDASGLSKFEAQYHAKLAGRILLLSPARDIQRPATTDFQTLSPAAIDELRNAKGEIPPIEVVAAKATPPALDPGMKHMLDSQSELFSFLNKEKVIALLQPAPGGGGTHFVLPPLGPPDPGVEPPPTIELEPEHYNRIVRLLQHDVPVELELNVHTEMYPDAGPLNVVGEISGTEKPNEVIMAGAHLDSFQLATGATDNAANVAVVMEAARILKALNLPLKRTVRFGFWGAEEIDRQGSKDYVRKHILRNDGDSRIECYFNIDYGTGKVRGVYLQGHSSLAPTFQQWLAPFADVGGNTVTEKVANGSDQKSFNDAGVLGVSFIQDPLDYESRTHHTNMDTFDYLVADNLKQNAMMLATILYRSANADEAISTQTGATQAPQH